jgi:hypothetical protein
MWRCGARAPPALIDRLQSIDPLPLAGKLGQGLKGGKSSGDLCGGHSGLSLTACCDPANGPGHGI